MLQFFSASTSIVNSKRAITECLENALQGEPDLNCDLIIIYSAMGHNFKDLLSEAHRLAPGARIAGCTGGGVIGKSGPDESMRALAIMAIKGPGSEFALVCRRRDSEGNTYEAIHEMALELKEKNPGINMVLFLPSGGNDFLPAEKALGALKNVFGKNIPVSGGFAMTSMANLKTTDIAATVSFQFYDDEIIRRGAVMIGYADPTLKFINHANHGFDVLTGMTMEVTKSNSHQIFEINGKPSWTFLTETLGVPDTLTAMELLTISGFARELPEKLWEENGSKYLISVAMERGRGKSIFLPVECPEGMKLWLTKRDEKMMFSGVDFMVQKIVNELQGRKPLAVFHADCVLRGRHSLDRILKDEIINRMQSPICNGENIPWLGLYSAGEFLMLGGEAWFQQISSSLFVIYR
jgi:hypothetical protein